MKKDKINSDKYDLSDPKQCTEYWTKYVRGRHDDQLTGSKVTYGSSQRYSSLRGIKDNSMFRKPHGQVPWTK